MDQPIEKLSIKGKERGHRILISYIRRIYRVIRFSFGQRSIPAQRERSLLKSNAKEGIKATNPNAGTKHPVDAADNLLQVVSRTIDKNLLNGFQDLVKR
jgi:hypothetical protein